jgi:hypothetical protein
LVVIIKLWIYFFEQAIEQSERDERIKKESEKVRDGLIVCFSN